MSFTFVPSIQSNKEGFSGCHTYRAGNEVGQRLVYQTLGRLCGIIGLTRGVMLRGSESRRDGLRAESEEAGWQVVGEWPDVYTTLKKHCNLVRGRDSKHEISSGV